MVKVSDHLGRGGRFPLATGSPSSGVLIWRLANWRPVGWPSCGAVELPYGDEVAVSYRAHISLLERHECFRPSRSTDVLDLESIWLIDLDNSTEVASPQALVGGARFRTTVWSSLKFMVSPLETQVRTGGSPHRGARSTPLREPETFQIRS